MQQPPDFYKRNALQPQTTRSRPYPGQQYPQKIPLPQDIQSRGSYWPNVALESPPRSTSSSANMHLPTSRTQKFFVAVAFLLVVGAVLALPCLFLQQYFFSNNSSLAQGHIDANPIINLNATAIANVKATPGPPGKIILPLKDQIMTGVSMPGNLASINQFEQDAGKKVSVLLLYQPWGVTDGEQDFPAQWASAVRSHGSLPLITWEPWIPKAYPADNNEPTFALKNIIDGKFDHYITTWAETAKEWRYPFFLRLAPEMNGSWAPWSEGLNSNKAGQFVQAWRHVHDIFTSLGVTNATWMWCPNINFPGSLALSELYPGDAYVDWTGMDGFNWGTTTKNSAWLTFSQVFSSTYHDILGITKKPLMIVETGSVEQGGDEAAWITNAYSVALPDYFSSIKGIVWFNQITQEDWRIESSPGTTLAFSTAIKSSVYAANVFANYLGG